MLLRGEMDYSGPDGDWLVLDRRTPRPRVSVRRVFCEVAGVVTSPDVRVFRQEVGVGIRTEELHRVTEGGADVQGDSGCFGTVPKAHSELVYCVDCISFNDPESALGQVNLVGYAVFTKQIAQFETGYSLPLP